MKATIPIGIQPGTRLLRIERVPREFVYIGGGLSETTPGYWIVWIHHNPDFTLGTYLTLYQDGHMTNTTVHEDGTENVFQVKPPDD
jgi:hypothetical protein